MTPPRCAKSARNTSPGSTGTILWTAPGSTMSPALSPDPEAAQLVREPGNAASGVTERGRAGTGVDHLTVPGNHDPEQAQIEILDLAHPAADHQQAGRRVVGHGVHQLDLPVGDPAVDDLHRRQRTGDRAQRTCGGHPGPGQVGLHQERQFGLHPRLHQTAQRDEIAVLDEHLVGEHAEVGFVDAEQLLHRRRGQADLAPDDPLAVRDPTVDVDRLDGIGILHHQGGVTLGQRRDGLRRPVRFPQLVGKLLVQRSRFHPSRLSGSAMGGNQDRRRFRAVGTAFGLIRRVRPAGRATGAATSPRACRTRCAGGTRWS